MSRFSRFPKDEFAYSSLTMTMKVHIQSAIGSARTGRANRRQAGPLVAGDVRAGRPAVSVPLQPCSSHHGQARVTMPPFGRKRDYMKPRTADNKPSIIADEPAGNLDTQTSTTIVELLSNLSRTEGTTVIIVSHDASVADQADMVLRLEDDRLALRA